MKFRILFFVLVSLVSTKLLLVSCAKEKSVAPVIINQIVLTAECPDTIFYSTQIKPFIDINCATSSCHSASAHAAGYDLSNHANVSANLDIIIQSMDPTSGLTLMPLGGAIIDATTLSQIKCWKGQGKLNN
jgi:hypothetical protein